MQLDALHEALVHALGPVDGPALAARQRAPELADLEFWVDALVEQILDGHDGRRAGEFRSRLRHNLQALGQAVPGPLGRPSYAMG